MNSWEKGIMLEGKFLHVRCLAHIINLIVRSALHLLDKSVGSIRNAVRYVRSSSSRLDAFKACCQKEDVESKKIYVLDVPTRWNSTYIMLDTALGLRKAFDRLQDDEDVKYTSYFDEEEEPVEEDGDEPDDFSVPLSQFRSRASRKRVGPPNKHDWAKAVVFIKFLKVFYEVTLRVSATKHPTSPHAFHDIVAIHAEIEDLFTQPTDGEASETQKVLFQMAQKMRAKYTKYFGKLEDINQLLLVALVLDPRYKLRNVERTCKWMLNMEDSVVKQKSSELKDLVVTLIDLYASSNGAANSQKTKSSSDMTQVGGSSSVSGKMADMLRDWEKELEDGDAVVVNNEVEGYLLDPIKKPHKGTEFKMLTWWKLNGPKYPNLQALAKDFLAIQVSTVASESTFSTGKRVIDPHRSSLTPRSIEALICLQNWLKSDAITNLAYVPTPEETEWFEEVEQEQDKEERERKKKEKEKEATVSTKASKVSRASTRTNAAKAIQVSA